MSANWIAVSSNVAVPDSAAPLIIEFQKNQAVIKPLSSGPLKGVIHIPFPSSPNGSNKMKSMDITYTTTMSKFTHCQIHHGTSKLYGKPVAGPDGISPLTSIPSIGDLKKCGWTVSLEAQFVDRSSYIELESAYLEFES